jgi:hypothetical protein
MRNERRIEPLEHQRLETIEDIWWVADGLRWCPPHAWSCPKVTKLDPEQVAWTCVRCGAIAQTDDPAVRPVS